MKIVQSAILPTILACVCVVATSSVAPAQVDALMPQPASLTKGEGALAVDESFRVAIAGYREARLETAATRLISRFSHLTGIPFAEELETDPSKAKLVIEAEHAGESVQSVNEDESYKLVVTSQQARLTAPTPVGILRGMETFLQLVSLGSNGFEVAAVEIDDHPRFPWRGLMLDVSRHWMPLPVIYRNLDAMAAVKLNVFHWHLSDNQGFRVESKVFPKLQEMGSDGHFYTQEEVKQVIAYARDRGIRVVPEFDMPGHATAWFVGYPELASGPGPYRIERHWGIFDPAMDPTRDSTFEWLDKFIGEMAALFPDPFFHIGGDEVNGKEWKSNPRIQAYMQEHGIKSTEELQELFTKRLLPLVQKHGKQMVGWDEILQPGFPPSVVIQSWRGQKSLAEAAKQGYRGILSAGYYLDLMESAARHYKVDPMVGATAGLTPEQKRLILGGEAAMWVEFATPENVDTRIWPRMAAIAERLWSPQDVTDLDSMYQRMAITNQRLQWAGTTNIHNREMMLHRLTNNGPTHSLEILDSILEPVKEYAREGMRVYSSFTPLNRLVDATWPESETARQFSKLVGDPKAHQAELRKMLTAWRDNRDEVMPVLKGSSLLQEAEPLAQDVADLSSTGIEALDAINSGKAPPESWMQNARDLCTRARKPRAELLIMVVPSIQKLVEAAGTAR
jgi:hexosaminidase